MVTHPRSLYTVFTGGLLKSWRVFERAHAADEAEVATRLAAFDALPEAQAEAEAEALMAAWLTPNPTVDECLVARVAREPAESTGLILAQLEALAVPHPMDAIAPALGLLAHWDRAHDRGGFPLRGLGSAIDLAAVRLRAYVGAFGAWRLVFDVRSRRLGGRAGLADECVVIGPRATDGRLSGSHAFPSSDPAVDLAWPSVLGPWREIAADEGRVVVEHLWEEAQANGVTAWHDPEATGAERPSETGYYTRLAARIIAASEAG